MGVIPEIGDWVETDDSKLPVLVAVVNFSPEYFSAVYYDGGRPKMRTGLGLAAVKRIIPAARAKTLLGSRLDGEPAGPEIVLSPREEAQLMVARAGELAAQKRGFILGGTSAVNTKQEGS